MQTAVRYAETWKEKEDLFAREEDPLGSVFVSDQDINQLPTTKRPDLKLIKDTSDPRLGSPFFWEFVRQADPNSPVMVEFAQRAFRDCKSPEGLAKLTELMGNPALAVSVLQSVQDKFTNNSLSAAAKKISQQIQEKMVIALISCHTKKDMQVVIGELTSLEVPAVAKEVLMEATSFFNLVGDPLTAKVALEQWDNVVQGNNLLTKEDYGLAIEDIKDLTRRGVDNLMLNEKRADELVSLLQEYTPDGETCDLNVFAPQHLVRAKHLLEKELPKDKAAWLRPEYQQQANQLLSLDTQILAHLDNLQSTLRGVSKKKRESAQQDRLNLFQKALEESRYQEVLVVAHSLEKSIDMSNLNLNDFSIYDLRLIAGLLENKAAEMENGRTGASDQEERHLAHIKISEIRSNLEALESLINSRCLDIAAKQWAEQERQERLNNLPQHLEFGGPKDPEGKMFWQNFHRIKHPDAAQRFLELTMVISPNEKWPDIAAMVEDQEILKAALTNLMQFSYQVGDIDRGKYSADLLLESIDNTAEVDQLVEQIDECVEQAMGYLLINQQVDKFIRLTRQKSDIFLPEAMDQVLHCLTRKEFTTNLRTDEMLAELLTYFYAHKEAFIRHYQLHEQKKEERSLRLKDIDTFGADDDKYYKHAFREFQQNINRLYAKLAK